MSARMYNRVSSLAGMVHAVLSKRSRPRAKPMVPIPLGPEFDADVRKRIEAEQKRFALQYHPPFPLPDVMPKEITDPWFVDGLPVVSARTGHRIWEQPDGELPELTLDGRFQFGPGSSHWCAAWRLHE